MLGAILRRWAADANAAADAMERLAARPKVTIRIDAGGDDRARAEEITRNLTPETIKALRKKLGLS